MVGKLYKKEGKENIFVTEYKKYFKVWQKCFCEKIRFLSFKAREKERVFHNNIFFVFYRMLKTMWKWWNNYLI